VDRTVACGGNNDFRMLKKRIYTSEMLARLTQRYM
jgi:hypothetical protein